METLDQLLFTLEDDKFKQFSALLDAPAEPNTGLERLFAVQAPWVALSGVMKVIRAPNNYRNAE